MIQSSHTHLSSVLPRAQAKKHLDSSLSFTPHIQSAPQSNFYPLKMYPDSDHFSPPGLLPLEWNPHHPSSGCSDWALKSSLSFHHVSQAWPRHLREVTPQLCSEACEMSPFHLESRSESSHDLQGRTPWGRPLSFRSPLSRLLGRTAPAPNKPGAPLPPGLFYFWSFGLECFSLNIHMAHSITFFSLFA